MILSFLGINEPVILFGGGIVVLAVNRIAQRFRIDLPTIALTLLTAVTRFRFPLFGVAGFRWRNHRLVIARPMVMNRRSEWLTRSTRTRLPKRCVSRANSRAR